MSKRQFWIGSFAGAVVALLLAFLLTVSGALSMAATGEYGVIDFMGQSMWESSMYWRAPDEPNPFADDPAAIDHGFEHYRALCVHCHGAPHVDFAQWAHGMHPMPPDLTTADVQQRSDGKLFYVIKYGVRATGMPAFGGDQGAHAAHSDEDIWHLVAFIRRLGSLTEEQERGLKEAVEQHEHL